MPVDDLRHKGIFIDLTNARGICGDCNKNMAVVNVCSFFTRSKRLCKKCLKKFCKEVLKELEAE